MVDVTYIGCATHYTLTTHYTEESTFGQLVISTHLIKRLPSSYLVEIKIERHFIYLYILDILLKIRQTEDFFSSVEFAFWPTKLIHSLMV